MMILFFLTSNIIIVLAETETLATLPGEVVKRDLYLEEGEKINGNIEVYGDSGEEIDFFITNPQGNTIYSRNRMISGSFTITASMPGHYILYFDNSFSTNASKNINLTVNITPFTFERVVFLISTFSIVFIFISFIFSLVIFSKLAQVKHVTKISHPRETYVLIMFIWMISLFLLYYQQPWVFNLVRKNEVWDIITPIQYFSPALVLSMIAISYSELFARARLLNQIRNLKNENEKLKRTIHEIEKKEPEIMLVKNMIAEKELKNDFIDILQICNTCNLDKNTVEVVLKELEKEGILFIYKGKIINKLWIRQIIRNKII